MKKAVLKHFAIKVADLQLYQKETPTLLFSSEYCEIFEEHLLTAVSDFLKKLPNTGEQLLLY